MRIFYTWDLSDPPRFHHEPIDGTYFDWLFSRLAGTGITFLFRCNLAGRTYYHSELMKPMDESAINSSNPQALEMWRTVTRVLEVCNPLAEAFVPLASTMSPFGHGGIGKNSNVYDADGWN